MAKIKYKDDVERAARARSRHFRKLNEFGNRNSAWTIGWMIANGRGLTAFEDYPPGTFEAIIKNDREVWFRRVV